MDDALYKNIVEKGLQTRLNLRGNNEAKEQGKSCPKNSSYNNIGAYNNRDGRGYNKRGRGGTSNLGHGRNKNFTFRGDFGRGRDDTFAKKIILIRIIFRIILDRGFNVIIVKNLAINSLNIDSEKMKAGIFRLMMRQSGSK